MSLPKLTTLAQGSSRFLRYAGGKLYYVAEWWEDSAPFPLRHEFEFSIPVHDPAAKAGDFLPYDKSIRFLKWIREERERQLQQAEVIATAKSAGTQCMGCQAGWPKARGAYGRESGNYHEVQGGYPGELVGCTRDRDGA